METSTVMRNVSLLREILSGKSYSDCATKFRMSTANVSSSIRNMVRHLKEYTSLAMEESSNLEYLLANKEVIEKCLSETFPRVAISPSAKNFLLKHFGKDYGSRPGEIAARWQEVRSSFNIYSSRRELQSIQKWLASENYLVGDIVTDSMLDFVFAVLEKKLLDIDINDENHSLNIEKVEKTGWKTRIVLQTKIRERDHHVTRRFSIELLPS